MLSMGQQLSPLQEVAPKLTKEQQVDIIRRVMSKPAEAKNIPRYRFTFGKFNGELLSTVVEKDRGYLTWCYHASTDLPSFVLEYIESEVLTDTTKTVQ